MHTLPPGTHAPYGPENMTRLRRFAIGLIKSKDVRSVAQKMRQLTLNTLTQFGDMLLKAQRAPIQINKNGKPVAVVISMDEYVGCSRSLHVQS